MFKLGVLLDEKKETYRTTGEQHMNKIDSVVKIAHISINLVVICQAERSQIKNKNITVSSLKKKLYNLEVKKRLDDKKTQELSKKKETFGLQIRNYILFSYKFIKNSDQARWKYLKFYQQVFDLNTIIEEKNDSN